MKTELGVGVLEGVAGGPGDLRELVELVLLRTLRSMAAAAGGRPHRERGWEDDRGGRSTDIGALTLSDHEYEFHLRVKNSQPFWL